MYTDRQLGYARTIVEVGRSMGVSDRGIVIGLSTALVETGLWNYANKSVPGSMAVGYDRVGSDSYSVGLFQQQPQWWGRGDGVDLMDPATAARLFYEQLVRLDYNGPDSPGSYAQAVQRSAFPGRYDERMGDARALFDMIGGGGPVSYFDKDRSMEFGFGRWINPANLVGVCIHTTESAPGATADDVTSYQVRSRTGSYNVMVGQDGLRILQNTDDWETWSTGNQGNQILLHLCFVARAAWSRDDWLAQDRMLRAGATVVKHWCDTYGWPVEKVDAWHLPGVLGHADTRVWGGTNHTDPGPNFPWDVFLDMVRTGGAPDESEDDMTPEQSSKLDRVHFELTERFQSRVEGSEYRDTLVGYALNTDASTYRLERSVAELQDHIDRLERRLERYEGRA